MSRLTAFCVFIRDYRSPASSQDDSKTACRIADGPQVGGGQKVSLPFDRFSLFFSVLPVTGL